MTDKKKKQVKKANDGVVIVATGFFLGASLAGGSMALGAQLAFKHAVEKPAAQTVQYRKPVDIRSQNTSEIQKRLQKK